MREKGKLQIPSQIHGSAFEIVWDSEEAEKQREQNTESAEEYIKTQDVSAVSVCLSPVSAVTMALGCGRSVLAQQGTGCRSCLALVLFSSLFLILLL